MATEIPEGLEELFQQTWFDHVLHYGLVVGAVFQLVCIAAIVLIPPAEEESGEGTARESPPAAAIDAPTTQDTATVVKGVMTPATKKGKKGGRKRK